MEILFTTFRVGGPATPVWAHLIFAAILCCAIVRVNNMLCARKISILRNIVDLDHQQKVVSKTLFAITYGDIYLVSFWHHPVVDVKQAEKALPKEPMPIAPVAKNAPAESQPQTPKKRTVVVDAATGSVRADTGEVFAKSSVPQQKKSGWKDFFEHRRAKKTMSKAFDVALKKDASRPYKMPAEISAEIDETCEMFFVGCATDLPITYDEKECKARRVAKMRYKKAYDKVTKYRDMYESTCATYGKKVVDSFCERHLRSCSLKKNPKKPGELAFAPSVAIQRLLSQAKKTTDARKAAKTKALIKALAARMLKTKWADITNQLKHKKKAVEAETLASAKRRRAAAFRKAGQGNLHKLKQSSKELNEQLDLIAKLAKLPPMQRLSREDKMLFRQCIYRADERFIQALEYEFEIKVPEQNIQKLYEAAKTAKAFHAKKLTVCRNIPRGFLKRA